LPVNLTNNAAIDVATGLILMYLLLSLSCTFINEMIATAFGLRAKTLEGALARLIDVPQLHADFYNHGLIDAGRVASRSHHVSYISGQSFALGLLAALDRGKTIPTFESLLGCMQKLPDSNIRDVIFVSMVAADGSIAGLRDNLACWFDQAMDRLGGHYNRRLKAVSLAVGITLAAAVNADTVTVSHALWRDGVLRAELLASAGNLPASRHPPVAEAMQAEYILRPLPVGWHFPIAFHHTLSCWLSKIAGLLMTGLALSLGAPFWFDLLSKCMNLRGTGSRPADNADAKSTLAN